MGSSSSRLRSRRRSPERFKLSSVMCGGGSSSPPPPIQIKDRAVEVLINSSEHCDPINDRAGNSMLESSSVETTREGSILVNECEGRSKNIDSCNRGKHLSEKNTESTSSQLVRADSIHPISYSNRRSDVASASLKTEQSLRRDVSHPSSSSPSGSQSRGDERVDVSRISSNVFSSRSIDQINRNASSRRTSNHLLGSPTAIFSSGVRNDIESHDRWVLDFAREFFHDEVGSDYRHMGSRLNRSRERRRNSRSMIWGGLHSDLDENSRHSTRCSFGLHPEGSCSCESFAVMMGDSSSRASISRIGLLAETLFEVFDEINRQPVSFSLPTVSLPAPVSVVDSFPLKNQKKKDSKDDIAKCYICLSEYEEGDKIRVLPLIGRTRDNAILGETNLGCAGPKVGVVRKRNPRRSSRLFDGGSTRNSDRKWFLDHGRGAACCLLKSSTVLNLAFLFVD